MSTKDDAPVMTADEWHAEAVRRFGDNPGDWRFKCVVCGHEQSINGVHERHPELSKGAIQSWIYFSCEGRRHPEAMRAFGASGDRKDLDPGVGCDYTLGGLFVLPAIWVIDEEGKRRPVFGFADAVGALAT